ncbi:LON peptidase substrate-binding domain-containing protein [Sulfobacillus sp. hq2]|nr:LON peptidase substrate-binding domain-containing protein [Sulfobacillus sp. hq2]MCY0907453.1 LON peptidase substrate-binding domain-containing protein [Sulfobacillus thermotolerans]
MPILPIKGILFPGAKTKMVIDDSSYKAMISYCIQQDTGLCVCMERRAQESGTTAEAAEPSNIGTSARILQVSEMDNGSLHVELAGISRISLLSYRHGSRYMVGQFKYLPDLDDSVPPPLIDEALALSSEIWSFISPTQARPQIPTEPEALSYWIAAHVPFSVAAQQELLELRTTRTRLSKEVSLVRHLIDRIRSEQIM